jgi:acyl-CoA thioester hydrolase
MNILSQEINIKVRFSEVDSLSIVWHGHYTRYFEDAREAFGEKYGLRYQDIYGQGFVTPIVKLHCEYKLPLRYGDTAKVEVIYHDVKAARIEMAYKVTHSVSGLLLATGSSTQVFLDRKNRELQLIMPAFFEEWKKKWGVCI